LIETAFLSNAGASGHGKASAASRPYPPVDATKRWGEVRPVSMLIKTERVIPSVMIKKTA
jgi:hypothetical protein